MVLVRWQTAYLGNDTPVDAAASTSTDLQNPDVQNIYCTWIILLFPGPSLSLSLLLMAKLRNL